MDGSSIGNAGTLASLNQFISMAGAGGEVLMLADQGAYQRNTQLSITCGGDEGAPVTIRGIDSSGHPMDAEIRGARAENWAPGKSTGSELFRLLSGADNLVFEDMNIGNVGNGAFRIAADIQNLTIRDVDATNVGRFVENYVSGTATTASVDGLTIQNVDIAGYSTNAVRLQYDSHDIVIQNVTGDSQRQNGGLYVSGILMAGTVHDVLLSQVEMRNSFGRGSSTDYWNGDGFTTERGVYNVRFEDTVASGNTDAGYDLKSANTTLVRALAEGNNENYRLWTDSITMTDSTSRDPFHYGGVGSLSHVWLASGAVVTLDHFEFSDSITPQVLFNLGQSGATLRLIDTVVPPEYEELIKAYKDSQIIFLHTPSDISVSGASVAENSAGGTLVGTLSVSDADAGDSHSFAFAGGGHPLFEIDGNQILVKAGAILDYEANRTHAVSITATDSAGLQVTRDFAINLTDVLDSATSGADTLVGIGGKLLGGLGNDTYIVTHATDTVVELAGQGTDTVKTSLSSYTLGANLENLVYTGHGNFTGTGNAAANQITGGDGADTLRGGNGNDVIDGGAGSDTIYGDANRDQIHGGAGNDIIRAGTFDDKVWGDDGNDQLFGDDGNDALNGGAGNDILTGGKSSDLLVGGGGADTYRFGEGDGVDRIDNRDADGAPDKLQLAAGVFVDEVWLSQQGDDLVASLLGSPDQIIFESWFSGGQVDRLELADGTHLDAAGVVDLLSAMSSIGAPPMSLDALTPAQHDAVLAAMSEAWS
ncbi:MAG TPA: cadherin domain-containing protein [Dongiaceae bacterium]|nr:cadherin domain-containing protein [Dongiaceae bacterium]